MLSDMKYSAIYIPGLGDKRKSLLWAQRQLLRGWRVFGIRTELFVVGWSSDADTFDERLGKLLRRIDELAKQGSEVVLVGASAGASTAVAAFAQRKDVVRCMVTICGQLRGIKMVPDPALDINPRFRSSLEAMEAQVKHLTASDRKRILTLRPRIDAVVRPEEASFPGGTNIYMPVVGHLLGISFAIACEGRRIARFIARAQ